MIGKIFEDGDWFHPIKYGYGTGLPMRWQGWVLLAAYILLMSGCGLLIEQGNTPSIIIALIMMTACTMMFLFIVKKRTKGGWKFRNGQVDNEQDNVLTRKELRQKRRHKRRRP